jgi:hypothetical protein
MRGFFMAGVESGRGRFAVFAAQEAFDLLQ